MPTSLSKLKDTLSMYFHLKTKQSNILIFQYYFDQPQTINNHSDNSMPQNYFNIITRVTEKHVIFNFNLHIFCYYCH